MYLLSVDIRGILDWVVEIGWAGSSVAELQASNFTIFGANSIGWSSKTRDEMNDKVQLEADGSWLLLIAISRTFLSVHYLSYYSYEDDHSDKFSQVGSAVSLSLATGV